MKHAGIIFFMLLCCSIGLIFLLGNFDVQPQNKAASIAVHTNIAQKTPEYIHEIPLPQSYKRTAVPAGSFADWLRQIHLRKNNTVYLYNGSPKPNQALHYAVLDFSTGSKDLQQCADAIMRLRAEYFFAKKEFANITFPAATKEYNFEKYAKQHNAYSHSSLMQFMETVYAYCGTYTVDAITKPIAIQDLQPGDVFVKAGAPGHAMIVADVAYNEQTKNKIYLLAQSFMPAQDMHLVVNPNSSTLSPWYAAEDAENIHTPAWEFSTSQLKRFR